MQKTLVAPISGGILHIHHLPERNADDQQGVDDFIHIAEYHQRYFASDITQDNGKSNDSSPPMMEISAFSVSQKAGYVENATSLLVC